MAHYRLLESLKRQGHRLVGPCPIHGGSNRRQFVVDLPRNTFFCFGDCGSGGGTLDMVARLERVDAREAACRLARWFALPPAHPPKRSARMSKPTHKVLAVAERDTGDQAPKSYYTRIGSAWPVKSGKGLTLVLDALPLNGRLLVLENDDEERKGG